MKPVVVLDIASVGYAESRKGHARGVHRVAAHTAVGLLALNECELRFVSTSSLAGSYDWLTSIGCEPTKVLFCTRFQLHLSRWADKVGRWIERTLPDRRLQLRTARWLLQRLAVWADAQSERIPERAIAGADIYHSTLRPIPKRARRSRSLKKFLTVVDVIPLTNPKSVGGKGIALLRKQLESLPAEEFAFCISETVREELLTVKELRPDHVFVTPLAAAREKFYAVTDKPRITATLGRHRIPNAPYFLALSSFDPRKNFEHVIACFDAMVARNLLPKHNLVIVGSNPERNRHVNDMLRTVTARNRVITPGFIPDADLAALYSGAVAFLFPSLSEGFGIPVLEAMQCGTPVISSNAPALPEVVGDGGLLLDARDVDAWINAMVRVETDDAYRRELIGKGFARAASFTWDRFVSGIQAGYRAALTPSRRADR